jgi:hypothetical protein
MAWPYLTAPFGDCFRHFYLFDFAIAKMVKKKFIQRCYICKVPRSSLAHPSRAVTMATLSSENSSSLASSSRASLSPGIFGAPVEKEAPPAGTSKSVPSSWEVEDPVAAPMVNPVSAPPVDAKLIVLSSDSKDEVDWKALITEDEVD